jgi:hypothetical protein
MTDDWGASSTRAALTRRARAISLPSVTSTVAPVPAADCPVVSALDGFTRPCVGCLDTATFGFENSPSLSSVVAPRRHGTGASGDSTSLYPGTGAQRG